MFGKKKIEELEKELERLKSTHKHLQTIRNLEVSALFDERRYNEGHRVKIEFDRECIESLQELRDALINLCKLLIEHLEEHLTS